MTLVDGVAAPTQHQPPPSWPSGGVAFLGGGAALGER